MTTITILTPTYNRSKELANLYNSLCKQTLKDFTWLIIDDGSTDGTETYIKGLVENDFKIKYIKKENGGKHTALNVGFSNLDTELVGIVDSDDILSSKAIEKINCIWNKYKNNKKLSGIVFRKKHLNGTDVSEPFKKDEFIDNYNKYVINGKIKGDKFEIFRSSILADYRYPEYKNEKFCGEGVLWSMIAKKYDMVFVNEAIYKCEYLNDGLTNSGRKMRLKNPRGGMFHSREYISSDYVMFIRIKNALLYLVYAFFANESIIKLISTCNNKLLLLFCLVPSYILYIVWKNKYFK